MEAFEAYRSLQFARGAPPIDIETTKWPFFAFALLGREVGQDFLPSQISFQGFCHCSSSQDALEPHGLLGISHEVSDLFGSVGSHLALQIAAWAQIF